VVIPSANADAAKTDSSSALQSPKSLAPFPLAQVRSSVPVIVDITGNLLSKTVIHEIPSQVTFLWHASSEEYSFATFVSVSGITRDM
jgi:hypothetical protein